MAITFVSLESMKGSSKGVILTERAPSPILTIECIREGGRMACYQALVFFPGLMEIGTKENIKRG